MQHSLSQIHAMWRGAYEHTSTSLLSWKTNKIYYAQSSPSFLPFHCTRLLEDCLNLVKISTTNEKNIYIFHANNVTERLLENFYIENLNGAKISRLLF